MKKYYAHYRKEDKKYQYLEEHLKNTANLSMNYCSVDLLKRAAWLTGFYHDLGKATEEWQEYFEKNISDEKEYSKDKIDHSTLGGIVAEMTMPDSLLAEMIEKTVYDHHGIADCVSMKDGTSQIQKRRNKSSENEIESVRLEIQNYAENISLEKIWKEAANDIEKLKKQIFSLCQKDGVRNLYGNRMFFLGMCERMLLSCLMDADSRDTADFVNNQNTWTGFSEQEIQKLWEQSISDLERKLQDFKGKKEIDLCRKEISRQCKEAGNSTEKIYRLSVPTGAGKTLSSLRFALHCAKTQKKSHIFYIAPFRSIIEQNAEVIRSVFKEKNLVLEHHSDVFGENIEEMKCFERLIENWDEVPVIVTTAVQFLNTLFKEKKRNIRRFHSLCNSVIIIDEIQALPVKIIQLFNMAMNFLTQICNTTIVFCTATQPLLDKVRDNRLIPPRDMITDLVKFENAFQRVEFFDYTEKFESGASQDEIVDIIIEQEQIHRKVLVIVNTKPCAEKIYSALKHRTDAKLFHLSTWMCAEHRDDVLDKFKEVKKEQNVICISTQLIEAGVDISCNCVIRSLAGLDNLIQSAGRCNRNREIEKGYVYLVRLSQELENISNVEDIKKAQEAMKKLLIDYRKNSQFFKNRLDSEIAISYYYRYYFYDRQNEMNSPVKIAGVSTNLVDLFSGNQTFSKSCSRIYLKQAFCSAGREFQVIEENGGIDVIVPYGQSVKLLDKLQTAQNLKEKRQIIRELQRYTVHLSNKQIQNLKNAVDKIENQSIYVLADGYYSLETGVTESPIDMPFLCI